MLQRPVPNCSDSVEQKTFIQIVPRRTDEHSGITDYASALAFALRSRGLNTVFLAAIAPAGQRVRTDGLETIWLAKRQARCLADTLQFLVSETRALGVLLHLSGYGYDDRGAPLWLLKGLQRWRSVPAKGVPLLTIFHELYAMGRPWQSSFWLSPVQRLIARGVLDASSSAVATTELFRDRLREWNPRARIAAMPVFSNVGEPENVAPPGTRRSSAVVFGLAGVEDRLFRDFRPELECAIVSLGIEEITDIGPRFSKPPTSLAGVPVISNGALPPFAVSELLRQARFGFVAYPFDVLAKSGVFAAYAAHGTVPVVFATRRDSFDGLQVGRHFLDGRRLKAAVDVDEHRMIQSELSAWYEGHSVKTQARFVDEIVMHPAV